VAPVALPAAFAFSHLAGVSAKIPGGDRVRTRLPAGGSRIRTIGRVTRPRFDGLMSPLLDSLPTENSARTGTDTPPPGAFRGTDGSNPVPSSAESRANLSLGERSQESSDQPASRGRNRDKSQRPEYKADPEWQHQQIGSLSAENIRVQYPLLFAVVEAGKMWVER
jgi:hypothetical protein